MKPKKVWLNSCQIKKIIELLEEKNNLVFHTDQNIYVLVPDDYQNTLSRVSIFPPYIINVNENGYKKLETGGESPQGFHYIYSLKNMFLEAATKLRLI